MSAVALFSISANLISEVAGTLGVPVLWKRPGCENETVLKLRNPCMVRDGSYRLALPSFLDFFHDLQTHSGRITNFCVVVSRFISVARRI